MDGWVASWGCALQPPDQSDDPQLAAAVLRQTIRVSLGGRRARLVLSNEYGERPLELSVVTVARPAGGRAGASAVEPGSSVRVTFAGAVEVAIPPGARAYSDPFDYAIEPRSNLTVTMHVRSAPSMLTTHPGSRTTSYAAQRQEQCQEGRLVVHQTSGGSPSCTETCTETCTEMVGATPVTHWYFLAAVEVQADQPDAAAVVCLGDSLTDGRGSTTDGNDRWPDVLADRLHGAGLSQVAVVNQAAGGSRILRDGLGIATLRRLDRDVLGGAGVRWLILSGGVNDIGQADATPHAQQRIGDELVAGYAQVAGRVRERGIRVYAATITPFGGHGYDDPAGLREQTRQRVNAWIRAGEMFDAVIDFDHAVRSPDAAKRVRPGWHDGDGLHLNPAGYRALAAAVPIDVFRGSARR